MASSLRPHQEDALELLRDGNILCGQPGSGKSRVAIAYYMKHHQPKDIYVITTAKKRDSLDWVKEAAAYAVGTESDATVAGVLRVDSWNNIAKYIDTQGAFFIFDEQRLVGSGAWVKAFLKIAKHNNWILLSGTPGDTWMDYIPVFLANGFYKNKTEFVRTHVVFSSWAKFPKVERYLGAGKLNRLRREILVDMPFETHTVQHDEIIRVGYDKTLYDRVWKDRWDIYEEKPIDHIASVFYLLRKVVNSDSERFLATRQLVERVPRLIIFYNFDYELEILRELGEDVPIAEWNGHKHEEIPDTERWVYLVQYTAGSEGWNCITTNATLFYSPNYSYKVYRQARGRIDRLNTPYVDLYYYSIASQAPIERAIMSALRSKRTFNESAFLTRAAQLRQK
jgi:hypothetical protein